MKLDGLVRVKGEILWEATEIPVILGEVREELFQLISDIKTEGVPVAPNALPFESDLAVRPKHHLRAFYLRMASHDQKTKTYVAVKGTEPLLIDQLRFLANTGMPLAWIDKMAAIDFFPIVEHKVPMLLTTEEALQEARIGTELYSKYVSRYKEVPYLPLPLAVVKWPAAMTNEAVEVLRPMLSHFSRAIVERLVHDGACSYIYHYRVAPFPRVFHMADDDATEARTKRLRKIEDLNPIIERWATLFVRLLSLGYFPASPTQAIIGQAVQSQNVVIGGGFVDLDSVKLMTDARNDREFLEFYALSLVQLANTVACYLFNGVEGPAGLTGPEFLTYIYIYELISRKIEEEIGEHGDTFDPRLKTLPPFKKDLAGLLDLASSSEKMPRLKMLQKLLRG